MKKSEMQKAIKDAELRYPQESCGLVVDGRYRSVRNSAKDPLSTFEISASDWADLEDEGRIEMVVHSHPDVSARPSESDKIACEASALPWLILAVHGGSHVDSFQFEPSGYRSPLVGRPFEHGTVDCLSIVLDYYERELGIDLGHYSRADNWWNEGQDLYRELLPKAGFVQVGAPLQKGDVVLMQIRAPVPNHAGVYLGDDGILASEPDLYPTPGSILHHLYGRNSTRDTYIGYWQEKTVSVWRLSSERKTENDSPIRGTRD